MKIDFDDYENQFKAIGQLRKHTETIDLILSTIDGGNEPVHQYFLALRAPKLWQRLIEYEQKQQQQKQNHQSTIIDEVSTATKLFTDDDRTSSSSSSNIKRLFVPKEFIDRSILLRILIDSMYRIKNNHHHHQQFDGDYSIAWKLLKIANEFQLDFLANDCIIYFHDRINLSNCIELWKIGLKFYRNPYGQQLARCSYRFLLANLVELLHSSLYGDTIKSLTIGQLKTIIDDNRLNIRNEMEIWFLIRKWMIESNNSGDHHRIQYFWPLFSQIRFNLIDPKMIKMKLIPDLLSFDYNHCNGQLWKQFQHKKPKIDLKTFRPRIPYQLLFLYGGYEDGYPSSTIKTFDIRSRQWFQFRPLDDDYPRVYHKLVNLGNKIYIIGGSDETRSFHCAVCYRNRYIIVCGGHNGNERLRSVEIYDCKLNHWHYLPSMQSIRSDASAVIYNDCIYVAGGIDLFPLNSMEYYSFVTNQWTIISFMHIQRRSFSLISYNGSLYAIGGCTEIYEYNCLKSVERYNPITNTWYFAPPLPQHRMSASVVVLEDRIFVIGGYDGFTTYRTVFVYNSNQPMYWQQLQYELPIHLSGSDACIIEDMTTTTTTTTTMMMVNIMDYSYYGQCSSSSSSGKNLEKFHRLNDDNNENDDINNNNNNNRTTTTIKRIWNRICSAIHNNHHDRLVDFYNRKKFLNYLQNEWQKFQNDHQLPKEK
ncbi:Kelch-like protein 10 [Dermatophagoides farinae]|uniref:Kelch-like protein 10 n=1 Tax=Dermatophagoides farinae TaxID=6954 RepID=A0A922L030_DERFA|nr:Kelch-like protein 10 [Dermatophagoides farinae]